MESVSYSEAKVFHTCEKQHVFTYGMGLYPIGGSLSEPVHTGVYGHRFLETFYKSLMEGDPKEIALQRMVNHAKEEVNTASLKAVTAAYRFADSRPMDGHPILVEQKIRTRVDDDLEITIVPDLVWEYTEGPWKGQCSVEDYKFVNRKWSETAINFYRQIPLYMHYLQENGYTTTKKGLLWFINRDTGVSQRTVVTPTKESMAGFIEEHLRTARRIIEFKKKSLVEMNKIALRTSNTDQCQKCFFSFPCMLELSGKDITKTLRTGYQEYKRQE